MVATTLGWVPSTPVAKPRGLAVVPTTARRVPSTPGGVQTTLGVVMSGPGVVPSTAARVPSTPGVVLNHSSGTGNSIDADRVRLTSK